jgi:hypothetical protein
MIFSLAQIVSHATRLAVAPAMTLSEASEYANIAIGVVSQAAGVQHAPRDTVAFASTLTSDNRLGYPTDFDYALGVKVGVPGSWSTATSRTTAWVPLTKEPAPWGDPYQSDTSGQPTSYAEFATWFEVRPSPDSAYSVELRYSRKLSELTASTATPALDEQWGWACVCKTAELISAVVSNMTAELGNRRRYAEYVTSLRVDQGRKRMDERGMHMTPGSRFRH